MMDALAAFAAGQHARGMELAIALLGLSKPTALKRAFGTVDTNIAIEYLFESRPLSPV